MKRKDILKLHQLKKVELREKLVQAKRELIDLKMVSDREKTKDTRAIAKKRDEIARIATILREKELLAEAGKGPSVAKAMEGRKEKNEKVSR